LRIVKPFDKVAEVVPFDLSPAYRTAQPYLFFRHPDHLPITPAMATSDVDLLADLKRVWMENSYRLISHDLTPSNLTGEYL
jgi:hypothetical protein